MRTLESFVPGRFTDAGMRCARRTCWTFEWQRPEFDQVDMYCVHMPRRVIIRHLGMYRYVLDVVFVPIGMSSPFAMHRDVCSRVQYLLC